MATQSEYSVSVLLVCMGNICRSPMAEGAVRKRLDEQNEEMGVLVDSAGTHSYHVGAPPDPRAQAAAERRGIDISMLQARRVNARDFDLFDYILVMDSDNLEALRADADQRHHNKIQLFLDFADRNRFGEVPDPYYGGAYGFEKVLDLVDEAAEGLVNEIARQQRLSRRR